MARRTLRRLLGLDAGASPEPVWAVLTHAANEPEEELLAQLVAQQGIPVHYRRPPGHADTVVAGPCVVFVPQERVAEARALLESLQTGDDEASSAS